LSLSLNGKAPRKVVVFSRARKEEDTTISSLSRAFLLVEDKELFSESRDPKEEENNTTYLCEVVCVPFCFVKSREKKSPKHKKRIKNCQKSSDFSLPP
jgi:hypothetical protein